MDKIKDKIKYCDEVMTNYITTGDPFAKPAMPNPFEDERKIDIITFLYAYCLIWRQFAVLALNLFAEKENVPDYDYLIIGVHPNNMIRLCEICSLPLIDDIVFNFCGNSGASLYFSMYRKMLDQELEKNQAKEAYETAANAFTNYREQVQKALKQEEENEDQ